MSEEILIQHCAPTLAGLKTGNLFSFRFADRAEMMREIRAYNRILSGKGICIIPLRYRDGAALLYVYRPSALQRDLTHEEAIALLAENGYAVGTHNECIRELIRRLECAEQFPHEIGLFLSYPLEDVRGFIEQKAANYKVRGFWKVYGDPERAEQMFRRYRHCTEQYQKSWAKGRPLSVLAVAK